MTEVDPPEYTASTAAAAAPTSRRSGGAEPGPGVQFTLLGWCLWLLGAWAVGVWIKSVVPAARWMVLASMVGLMLVWPAVRLSQVRSVDRWRLAPAQHARLILLLTFLEWLCLILIFQAVVWPLGVVGQWALSQTLWLNVAVLAWSLLVAALVAWGSRSRATAARLWMMVVCVALVFAEPLAMALWQGGLTLMHAWTPTPSWLPAPMGAGWTMRISPIQTLWALTGQPAEVHLQPWALRACSAAVAAVAAWGVLILATLRHPSEKSDET